MSQQAERREHSRDVGPGWHCCHFYYRFDRSGLSRLAASEVGEGRGQMIAALDPAAAGATARLQTFVVSGHKADFGLLLMDPDPLKIDAVHQTLLSGRLGPCLQPVYSFVSLTEVSEYVPTVSQYAARLIHEGESESSPTYQARVKAYQARLAVMNRQRLTPDFPDWPAICFYPMNKRREVGANWFRLPFSERSRLMTEHGRSGMRFADQVSQLISVGIGLDDWEWGVTLWARQPQYLKDIVYRLRFDEASAVYAEFGPFFAGYVMPAAQILQHCRIGD